jgi:predicted metal-binding protein
LLKPTKFSGALNIEANLVIQGEDKGHFYIHVPVVEGICPNCKQIAVNDPSNQFQMIGEPNLETQTLIGYTQCNHCGNKFNETVCYFHNNQQLAPITYLATCILTDENPFLVIKRGFIPGRALGQGVYIGEGAQIGEGVRLEPPVLINKGSKIADNCSIGPFVYLEDAKIEQQGVRVDRSDVRRSVLNRSARTSTIYDSYIGRA